MSNFPVPPRIMDGLLNAPPQNRNYQQYDRRVRNDHWNEGTFDQKPPRGFREQPKPLMEDEFAFESNYRSTDGMARESSNRTGRDFRGDNGNNDRQYSSDHDRRQQPQSLLSKPVVPPLMSANNFRIPKSQKQVIENEDFKLDKLTMRFLSLSYT